MKLWLQHARLSARGLVVLHLLILLLQWITFARYPALSSRFDGHQWWAVCVTLKTSAPPAP